MTKSLRVAIVSLYPADPDRISGGVRAVTYQLVQGLRRHGELDIHVVHCHSDIREDRVATDDNVTVHYLGLPQRRLVPNMMKGLRRIAERLITICPQVVNAHAAPYAVAALRAGYHPVWTIHGVLSEEVRYNPGLFNKLAFALAGRYEREALKRVRHITAISPYIRDCFKGRTLAGWHLIENPAPDELFTLERQPVAGRLLLPAAVIPRKDPIMLVRALALAARQMPELHLQIAGRTNESVYVSQLRAACQDAGVADRVRLLGVQNQAQMWQLYREADLVVLSSREEVSPMSLIEGLAAGIPAVTTRAGGAGYIVEDGVTGRTVPVGDAETMAAAILDVLGSEGRREMGIAARAAAEDRFRRDNIAASYLSVYRRAAESAW